MNTAMTCPLPGCEAELYLTMSLAVPIEAHDTAEDLRTYRHAVTERWTVDCTEGHTVLLPLSDWDSARFGDNYDAGAEDDVLVDDLARLHALYPAPLPEGQEGNR